MALIVTPGQLTRRAEFYHQLAQFTAAGIGLVGALGQLQRQGLPRADREPIRLLLRHLAEGYTLTEGLQHLGPWLPAFDIALLQASEQSGRLDTCFRLLADYYTDRARVARQVLADLAYPLFLFHFAVFIIPFPRLFLSGDWLAYLLQVGSVLLPVYLVTVLLIYAAQGRHGEAWRARMEWLLHRVPMLGTARQYLALARLAAALEGLLSAGVTVIEAWEMAAAASGSPALRRVVLAWRPELDSGQTPGEMVSASRYFPELFSGQYATGETSGQLDETLVRLHRYYQEEGTRKLHIVAQWTPRAIYLCVVFVIAYFIIQSWSAHFKMIQDAINF